MMDLKEIIKWFIPCFHILRIKIPKKMDIRLAFICLFLLFNCCFVLEATANSDSDNKKPYLESTSNVSLNLSSLDRDVVNKKDYLLKNEDRSLGASWSGRTFGRPFKKMMAGLLPIVFQLGAASTWAMVATLIGVKTLVVTLIILKLLLMAGAAKFGALIASKDHHKHHEWTPQKEIHLHIHNGHHEAHEGHFSPWSREGYPVSSETKNVNIALDPTILGPQTISTPYGNYMKIDPNTKRRKRRNTHRTDIYMRNNLPVRIF